MNPITRQEIFLAAASGEGNEIPEPITREEMYLKKIAENGGGGGTGGTTNYNALSNKPKINNVELSGNKSLADLGIPTKTSQLNNDDNVVKDASYVHTDNNYDATAKSIVDGVTNALSGKVDTSSVGASNGVAQLDENGKIPSSQLPGSVDAIVEGYYKVADGKFYEESTYETEITPASNILYIDLVSENTYRWSGSIYVQVSESLALGETAQTAYAGDKGKANADAITNIKDGTNIDSFSDVETALTNKADKVNSATNGNFAALDANGNLKDSGKKASDFATPTNIQNLYADNGLLGAKNLLPTPYYSTKGGKITSGTLTVTENADGSVKINGTASGQSYIDLANNDTFLKAGTYILSGGLTSKQYVYINCLNNGTYVRTLVNATTSEAEFVLDYNGYDAITVGISIAGGESLDNVTFYPMIRLADDVDSTYKPYAKTNRQLTKDSVTWDDLSEVGAVNRLKGTLTTAKTVDTHTFTPNSDGSITITNTGVTTATPLAQKIGQFVGDGSVVKLSGGISGGSSETYCLQVQEGSTWKFIYDTGKGAIFQTVAGTTYGIYVVVRNGYSVSGTVYPMIADVSYNGSYVPYAMTNKEITDDVISLKNTKQNMPTSTMAFVRYIEWQGADTTRRLTMTANRARKSLLLIDNQNVAFVYFNEASAPIITKVNGFANLTITLVSGTLRDHGTAVYDIEGLTAWGSHVIADFSQYSNGNANDVLTLSAIPTT